MNFDHFVKLQSCIELYRKVISVLCITLLFGHHSENVYQPKVKCHKVDTLKRKSDALLLNHCLNNAYSLCLLPKKLSTSLDLYQVVLLSINAQKMACTLFTCLIICLFVCLIIWLFVCIREYRFEQNISIIEQTHRSVSATTM